MSTTRSFGIITNVSGMQAGICVNSLDFNETVEVATAQNQVGAVTDIAAYSRKKTVSVTGVLDSAKGSCATAGSILTIGSKSYLIDSVQRKETNNNFVQVTLSAQTADDATITVISASSAVTSGN